jgi:purine-binding chemotaxis protein CheW
MQIVIFNLGKEQFAVETSKVQGINEKMEVTKVPKAPSYIKGIINLRGTVITLLDINMLLGISKVQSDEESVIILEMGNELVAIMVDQVDEVMDIDEDMLEKLDENKKSYIEGVINLKDRIITKINIDKLIEK